MGRRLEGIREYQQAFADQNKRRRAHKLASEIRKFEIDLYWKRATYFWTLIAATFAGYFALKTKAPNYPNLILPTACIGLVLSVSWYLVNRGSKYWQENWERHVDSLEDEFTGPLYKTTIAKEQFHLRKLANGYPFSVSIVNQLTSLFIALIWLGLALVSFPIFFRIPHAAIWKPIPIAVITVIFIALLFHYGRTSFADRVVDFYKHDLVSPPHNTFVGRNTMDIRERLKELNTKAYYLLVALSFPLPDETRTFPGNRFHTNRNCRRVAGSGLLPGNRSNVCPLGEGGLPDCGSGFHTAVGLAVRT